jgi:hypothetical protein
MSHQHRRRFGLRGLVIALLVLLPSGPLMADMGSTRYTIDFSKPEEAAKKARWSDPQLIETTTDGLGWEGEGKSKRDMWIESEPIAVGLWWRPTHSVSIQATLDPPGRYTFTRNSVAFPSGSLFVRYSPDARNWSSWQVLNRPTPKDRTDPKQQYVGRLGVPRRDMERYNDYLRQYMALDVPWKSDEEATVKWILEQEPDFFEKSLPFIGYVQFLYEASLPGGQRLKELRFEIEWGVGGIHAIPRDGFVHRESGPWRFRAKESRDAENREP